MDETTREARERTRVIEAELSAISRLLRGDDYDLDRLDIYVNERCAGIEPDEAAEEALVAVDTDGEI